MATGSQRPLQLTDMPPLYSSDQTHSISVQFAELWAQELRRPTYARAALRCAESQLPPALTLLVLLWGCVG
jgi:hypothetical protein